MPRTQHNYLRQIHLALKLKITLYFLLAPLTIVALKDPALLFFKAIIIGSINFSTAIQSISILMCSSQLEQLSVMPTWIIDSGRYYVNASCVQQSA
ncbi:hypothetical protein V2W45_1395865 [Cenococcum geophilum]